ncbi:MAG: hypothetical protein AAB497_03720 [Patescibacteria group bacterium]
MKKPWCVVLVILAVFAGMKWAEYSSTKKKEGQAQFTEPVRDVAGEKQMAKFLATVKGAATENERLRAENALLVAQLKDCKPVPPTKRIVPREGKPRTSKPKSCEKKVVAKPKEKAPAPPKAIAPTPPAPQEESLAEKVSRNCGGGPVKFVGGKWICLEKEVAKVQAEPTKPSAEPDAFFANAVDEDAGEQAPARTPAYTAPVYAAYEPLSRPNCMTEPFTDGSGRPYEAGYQFDNRSNGKCRCGSEGCDLRWPWQRQR